MKKLMYKILVIKYDIRNIVLDIIVYQLRIHLALNKPEYLIKI